MTGLTHVTAWGYFWLAWMLTALGVELYWIFVNSANTLSVQIWGIERIDLAHPLDFAEWTPLHIIITLILWGFFAWLSVHFPFGYIR
jgi:hypothetical protein